MFSSSETKYDNNSWNICSVKEKLAAQQQGFTIQNYSPVAAGESGHDKKVFNPLCSQPTEFNTPGV